MRSNTSKYKVLLLIIGMLLITNIVLIFYFLRPTQVHRKNEHRDKQQAIATYLEEEVGFSKEQIKSYDSISHLHKELLHQSMDSLYSLRKNIMNELGQRNFHDSAIIEAALKINAEQYPLEIKMLKHIRDIRTLCTPKQKERFDTSFYKIALRRMDTKSKKHQ